MNYLVVEVKPSYAILLDEEGRFVTAANLNYQVGETVTRPFIMDQAPEEPVENNQPKRWGRKRIVATITMIAAVIGLLVGVNFYQNNALAYSSIYLTINPDVQMELNRNGEVINLIAENTDGEALIAGYEPGDRNKAVVTNELIDRAIEMGFLEEGGLVSISIETPNKELFEDYGIELRRTVHEHLNGRISVTIEISTREDAEMNSRRRQDRRDADEEEAETAEESTEATTKPPASVTLPPVQPTPRPPAPTPVPVVPPVIEDDGDDDQDDENFDDEEDIQEDDDQDDDEDFDDEDDQDEDDEDDENE